MNMATNPLTDVVPEKARKYLYAVFGLASLAVTVLVTLDVSTIAGLGMDKWAAAVALVGAAFGATAASNAAPAAGKHRGEAGVTSADIAAIFAVAIFIGVLLLLFRVKF
jgi:hypothetical protein